MRLVLSTLRVVVVRLSLKNAAPVDNRGNTALLPVMLTVDAITESFNVSSPDDDTAKVPLRLTRSSTLNRPRRTERFVRDSCPPATGTMVVATADRLLLSTINSPDSLPGPCR